MPGGGLRRGAAAATIAAAFVLAAAACGGDEGPAATATLDEPTVVAATATPISADGAGEPEADPAGADVAIDDRFPAVVAVESRQATDKTWTFNVTISSPYDTPERYADAWRVLGADGETEYGVRILLHDHASEQPFTRSLAEVVIPEDVETVVVQGRDLANGWGGPTVTHTLER